ncbi:hypothetical protein Bbelb_328460 [Branchiostoma belcheri]|nr:hypothetical protein Bbelb_328460 [Branchiostoma belcheri]
MTRPGIELTTYRMQGEHSTHLAIASAVMNVQHKTSAENAGRLFGVANFLRHLGGFTASSGLLNSSGLHKSTGSVRSCGVAAAADDILSQQARLTKRQDGEPVRTVYLSDVTRVIKVVTSPRHAQSTAGSRLKTFRQEGLTQTVLTTAGARIATCCSPLREVVQPKNNCDVDPTTGRQ